MQRITSLVIFLSVSVTTVFAQKKEDVIAYINIYKELAINEMKRTGVPASIKLAQGIHETMAGKSDLVLKSNNHFGIKCKTGWAGAKVYHTDDAVGECFRSYGKAEDSYKDHSDFLKGSPRYAFLFDLDPEDYEAWAYGLKKAGYATNIKYSQILIRLIRDYNLQQYTLMALGKLQDEAAVTGPKKEEPVSNEAVYSEPVIKMPVNYPSGEFLVNNTKVIYVKGGTSWLSLAEKYNMPLSRLLDFNDLETDDAIEQPGQLVYIQRKRKVGASEFHVVQKGERMYEIARKEGIRLESLRELNHLFEGMEPAPGQKLNLQSQAAKRPRLIGEEAGY
ncbi:MAG TPA: glucosaminidase domain-containing protein [Chitinophagaceae bacterium]|nr:glucosaminidase domain-containing protein [Chitinophagaceae bacterium]